jgi:tetratricopeptide (TPR) repeat protein
MEEARRLRLEAERAEQATLWHEAARLYEECLSLVSDSDIHTDEDEAALLTGLGRCYWLQAEARAAWRTLMRAMAAYRQRGDGVGHAAAAAELMRIWGPRDRKRMIADEALEALGDRDPHLQALLLLQTDRWDEAMEIAGAHNDEDILGAQMQRDAWRAFDEGRTDDGLALLLRSHAFYAGLGIYDVATGNLRQAGFGTMEVGRLDEGDVIAARCADYARAVHIRFQEYLALMDRAGVAFARAEYDRCAALAAECEGTMDFRGELFLGWIAASRGEPERALRYLVDPARGGGNPDALGQIHAGRASLLFAAGQERAARAELEALFNTYPERGDAVYLAPAVEDCLVALGEDDVLRVVHDSFRRLDPQRPHTVYSTLQGRMFAPVRGSVALRLGALDDAEREFSAGLAVAERERCPVDAGRCETGLAQVARARGDITTAERLTSRARATLGRAGADGELAALETRLARFD